jgi:cytochrome c oxidase assembly protein subunit 15
MTTKKLHFYAIFVSAMTLLLLLAGGLVTSTGSSLSVPDWPLSYGQVFPKMEGGVFFEHGHRMIASVVGFLTIILAVWLWKSETRPVVRRLGFWALALIIGQGVLGGVTVLLGISPLISVLHACFGQTFFGLLVSIAVLTSNPSSSPVDIPSDQRAKIIRLGVLTIGFIYLQLIIGAIFRHTGKGLHLHMATAILPLVHVFLFTRRIRLHVPQVKEMNWGATFLKSIVVIQILLGLLAWKTFSVASTTIHLGVGALLLAGTIALTLLAALRLRAR